MAIYTVHGGHAAQGRSYCGASGYCSESTEDRKIKDSVIKYLILAGHTVYDCTVDNGTSQSNIISQIKNKINSCNGVTANISIHLNCYNGNAKGTECCVYSNSGQAGELAKRICSEISDLGFLNRGVKERTDLGVLKGITNGGANILVETFFCDSSQDFDTYKNIGADSLGKAIAEGILNIKLNTIQNTNAVNTIKTEKNIETINKSLKQNGQQERRITTMQCFYTVDEKGPVYYFDGKEAHPLSCQDEMTVLNTVYKDNNGKDMPCYSWSSAAPYHVRLLQAAARKR